MTARKTSCRDARGGACSRAQRRPRRPSSSGLRSAATRRARFTSCSRAASPSTSSRTSRSGPPPSRHAGSSVYLPLMNKGEMVMGLNSSLDSGLAVAGKERFKDRIQNVRLLARVWILPYAYMVKESSGIKTLDDFRGKKIVVNVKTNVSLALTNRTVLSTAGLTEKDVDAVDSGGVVAGINMVVEGRADATTVALAMPAMRKDPCNGAGRAPYHRARQDGERRNARQGHRRALFDEGQANQALPLRPRAAHHRRVRHLSQCREPGGRR